MVKGNVLIIDDEPLLVQSTSMVLKCYEFNVESAMSGKEGIDKAVATKPDIILLDVMMPGMDGWEVLAQLKANEKTSSIPVIMFTAKEYSNGKKLALEKGAADFLSKPFDLQDMVTVLVANIH